MNLRASIAKRFILISRLKMSKLQEKIKDMMWKEGYQETFFKSSFDGKFVSFTYKRVKEEGV